MRGRQYHGRIYPGPTALLLETPAAPVGKQQQSNNDDNESSSLQQLKVIGVTDEFVRCEEQQGDIMQRLSATYEQGGGGEEYGGNEPVKKTTVSSAKSTASARKRAKTSTASNAS